ncbi:MAG: HNH endonuclease signature motif containing protein [Cyanobacteria bacterium P01_E01_bin.6]
MLTQDYTSQKSEYQPVRSSEEFNDALQQRKNQSYDEFLLSPYWQDVRSLVLRRDKYCQACGSHELLQVHHKTYEHRGDELRHLDDLTTLCEQCHFELHGGK